MMEINCPQFRKVILNCDPYFWKFRENKKSIWKKKAAKWMRKSYINVSVCVVFTAKIAERDFFFLVKDQTCTSRYIVEIISIYGMGTYTFLLFDVFDWNFSSYNCILYLHCCSFREVFIKSIVRCYINMKMGLKVFRLDRCIYACID